jgi:uncharacterized protein YecE (DUF72 family)
MDLYCGTSGFSYKEWKGPFYPKTLPAAEMLPFYAGRLPAVEINNTFYRMPQPRVLDSWRDQVPESFRFVIKASRRISHLKRLRNCADEAGYLFDSVAQLGDRLGAVLVQLPPHFRIDADRLAEFLELVPKRIPVAFEFRHETWRDDAVLATLERAGAAWVTVDHDGAAPGTLPRTAAWTYLRLRAPEYSDATLQRWCDALKPFERAFVFFKHEDEGAAPALAERMLRLNDS